MIAGTRGSALALWQTEHVASRLRAKVTIEKIVTRGDVDRTSKLQGKMEKGFFTAELEAALREGRVDFAVHSLKDLPTQQPDDLAIAAVLERAAPNDRLLINGTALEVGMRVGASSLRREALLKRWFPAVRSELLRGNVPTRVQRLKLGDFNAIILAAAGLTRLKLDLTGLTVFDLNPRRWIPAPGQGAIAVQCRASDGKTMDALQELNHPPTARATRLERELLRIYEGGCSSPFGAYVEGKTLWAGAAYEGRWRTLKVPIPDAPDEAFYRATLDALQKAGTDDDEGWLHRTL